MAVRLVQLVEALHGKPAQVKRAEEVLDALLSDDRVQDLLDTDSPKIGTNIIKQALRLINLGEVEAPCAFYLAEGRATEEMRQNFAQRPFRAADFVARFKLAKQEVQQLLRQSHVDDARERHIAAQLLDLSERVAALSADRPHRHAMAPERIAAILKAQAEQGIFSERLTYPVRERLTAILETPAAEKQDENYA